MTVQRSTLIVPGGASFPQGTSHGGISTGGLRAIESLGRLHAEEHKYHLNWRRGYDLGSFALRDWCDRYWRLFVRWRHFEHITGQVEYPEFSARSFKCLASHHWHLDPVAIYAVMCVRDRLFENLDFFKPQNPLPSHICPKKLKEVLEMMDSDSARLPVPAWGRA